MSVSTRRTVQRIGPFVRGEHPDPFAPTFETFDGIPLDDIDGWTATAVFARPNGTTITVDAVITPDTGTPVAPFPPPDETGAWYAEAIVDNGLTGDAQRTYISDLYVFNVGDPIEANPGDPPPPGDHFITAAELEELTGLPGGTLPDDPVDGYVVAWDETQGIAVWVAQSGGGPGGGQVDAVEEGHAIAVTGTASHPIVAVDETALDVVAGLAAELVARAAADTALATSVSNEAAARAAADLLLIPLTEKGAANGVAPLGSDGKLGTSFLPALAINETFTAASQAAMLALTAQRGDVAVRTDLDPDGFFLLTTDSPSTLADWKQILAPGAVVTVDGRSGAVTLSDLYDVLGAAAAAQAFAIQRGNHSGTQAIATVTGLQAALDAKAADNAVVHLTGAETVAGVKNFTSTPLVPGASLAADQAAGTASPRTLGTSGTSAAAGNDARLTDSRPPTGAAGGVLAGTYPDPDFAVDMATQAELDTEADARTAADLLLIPLTQKGAASGVATLDGSGLIPTSQLPALAISSTFVVASQVAMLALTAQEGDVAVRTDLSKSFILTASPASTLGNWQELLTPTDAVLSVDGRSGTVSLADLYDADGAAATAQAFAIQRANHTGTQSADTLTDGTTNKAFLATERTKLAGIATGATANDTDANLKARANHTGTQTLATISDAGTAAALNSGTSSGNLPTVAQADARYERLMLATATKTASYTAGPNEQVPLDTSSATPIVVTLPTAPADGTVVEVGWILGGNATATIVTGGSDTFQGGGTSSTLAYLYQFRRYLYRTSGALWTVQNSMAISGLDARYAPNIPVVTTVTSSATPTYNVGSADHHLSITALATNITSMTTSATGSPNNFQRLIVRIKDDGTPRTIAWGASFASRGATLPTTTVAGKLLTVGFLWNSATTTYGCVAVAQEA